jgi:hypothetical protein
MTYDEAVKAWTLEGAPYVVRRSSGVPIVFVQRSRMRGRPWLRFGLALEGCGCCLRWRQPTAYRTRRGAVAG